MIMFPGGFSAGDEPDGSAKFFATAFQNAKMKEAVEKFLNERDGLALGICNGFQALIKLGLVPYGEIYGQKEDSPTLTYNTIGPPYLQDGLYKSSNQQISMASEKQNLAEYTATLHLMVKEDLLQIKNGLTSYSQMDRLQHSTVIRKEIYQ